MPDVDLTPLRDHLLRFYPPDHEVTFVLTDSFNMLPDSRSVALQDLAAETKGGDVSSLIVPRLIDPLFPIEHD